MNDFDEQLAQAPQDPVAPEMLRPSAPEVRQNPGASQVPALPQGNPWVDILQVGLAAAGAGGLLGPNSEQLGRLNERLLAQRQQKKAAEETQALTGLLTTALASGDPQQLQSVIKQMGGIKNLEPQTVQALQKLQVELGSHIGTRLQEDQTNKAIVNAMVNGNGLNTEEGRYLNSILAANPDMKPTDAVKFIEVASKMGLWEKEKVQNVHGIGLVRVPGTFGRSQGEKPSVLMPVASGSDKEPPSWDENVQRAGMAEFVATGKITSPRVLHALGVDPKDPNATTRAAEMLVTRSKQELDQDISKYRQQREIAIAAVKAGKADEPATGAYLDRKQGVQISPTYGDLERNRDRNIQRLTADQEKEWAATNTAYTHIEQTIKQVSALPNVGNQLSAMLNAKMSKFKNQPAAKVLFDALGPQTSLALGRALQGSGGRGGVRMAEYLQKAIVSEDDTLKTSLGKMINMVEIANSNARAAGLPTGRGDALISMLVRIREGTYGKPNVTTGLPGGFK